MRIYLLPLLLFISTIAFGQTNLNENQFNSVFQNLTSGNFNGTVNGILIIEDYQHKKSLLDFQGSTAKLEIAEDKHQVYDVSYKKYIGTTTSGKTTIKYTTYAYANALGIQLKDEYYNLTYIDGACDFIINGLEYSYEHEKSAEYLILRITKKIELTNDYDSKIRKKIKLLPNSTLIFAINRNK